MKRLLKEFGKGNRTYVKNAICKKLYPIWIKHKPHLDFLGFHVVDHCILHCKGCDACSPLVKKPWFYDAKVFEKDVEELSKKLALRTCEISGGGALIAPTNRTNRIYGKEILSIHIYCLRNKWNFIKKDETFLF